MGTAAQRLQGGQQGGQAAPSEQPDGPTPINVGVAADPQRTQQALLRQLKRYGRTTVQATGAANHCTALCVLARAQEALRQKGAGLHAVAAWQAADFELPDTKKRLRKLLVSVELVAAEARAADEGVAAVEGAAAGGEALHQPGGGGGGDQARMSANRTRELGVLCESLSAALSAAPAGAAAAMTIEARGEQAVCRALKAAMGVQQVRQQWLVLTPSWGPVADVVAENRGVQRTVEGLLLGVGLPQQPAPQEPQQAAQWRAP